VSFDSFQLTSGPILVVDDVPGNLTLVRVVLSRQGFEIHTATTAEEALELARKIHPCLILADILLPGMNGLEMTRRLKADPETMDIVVVAVTAFAMKGDKQKALDAGCDGYITKAIDVNTFPTLIRQYLK
jgi:CheY-like chemotaxis protein